MYDVVYIFRGILIGLMVSVPLGPMGVLIIQKTLQKGALAGFVAGMGAACADLFYATVAAFGLVLKIKQNTNFGMEVGGGFRIRIRDQCHTDSRVDPTDHRGNFSDYRRIENLFR